MLDQLIVTTEKRRTTPIKHMDTIDEYKGVSLYKTAG